MNKFIQNWAIFCKKVQNTTTFNNDRQNKMFKFLILLAFWFHSKSKNFVQFFSWPKHTIDQNWNQNRNWNWKKKSVPQFLSLVWRHFHNDGWNANSPMVCKLHHHINLWHIKLGPWAYTIKLFKDVTVAASE
jgi:hypothetical protein